MTDLKRQAEAILFSAGRFIALDEIARLCKKNPDEVKQALLELMADYENNKETSMCVISDGDMWKMTAREEYTHFMKTLVSDTELTKTQLETLAVIAFKYPIKQADLIKIRTNKAYDHLMELEKAGFITRQRYGRSRLIKLTDKFFDYFDLPREKLKEQFKGFEQLATTIEQKEDDVEKLKYEQQKMAEAAKAEAEQEKKVMEGEIDLFDEKGEKQKLETYEENPNELREAKASEEAEPTVSNPEPEDSNAEPDAESERDEKINESDSRKEQSKEKPDSGENK